MRGGKHIEVEAQLRKMIQDGKLLPKQAKICFLAKEMGIEASNGWYDRFRKRNFDLFPSTLKGTSEWMVPRAFAAKRFDNGKNTLALALGGPCLDSK